MIKCIPQLGYDKFTFFWEGPFSNWYPAAFTVGQFAFATSEQFMMFCKAILFNDFKGAIEIINDDNPRNNKKVGRKVAGFDPEIWNKIAKDIVYVGCKAKFTQNLKLLEELLATKETLLVEASPLDTIWGIGLGKDDERSLDPTQWRGTNWLGEVLTILREDLIAERLVLDLIKGAQE